MKHIQVIQNIINLFKKYTIMEKETEKEPNELELWKKMYTDKENELEACKKKLAAAALILTELSK